MSLSLAALWISLSSAPSVCVCV